MFANIDYKCLKHYNSLQMNDPCEVLIILLFSVIYKRKVSGYNRDLFPNTESNGFFNPLFLLA